MSPFEAAIPVRAADLAQRFRQYVLARDFEAAVWGTQGSREHGAQVADGVRRRGENRGLPQNLASGAGIGVQEGLSQPGHGTVDSQSQGIPRAVERLQSTPARGGRRLGRRLRIGRGPGFNPRPPAAGDASPRTRSFNPKLFQSTPARGGRQPRPLRKPQPARVSIHARPLRATS
jgi:hypothetical protein